MANEGYYSITFKATKSGATVKAEPSGRFDMAGVGNVNGTQNIGTASELITFGSIVGVPQMVMIQNLDATNFVEIGGNSGLTVFKLKILAGKVALIPLSSATLYAKADTAAVNVLVTAFEV